MLWIALSLPHLTLDALVRGAPHPDDLPARSAGTKPPPCPAMAICHRHHIVQCNPAAQALGVVPGQKRATALALAPDLHLHDHDPADEDEALRQIACWALQFTPRVLPVPSLHADGCHAAIVLDVEASLRLFGGLDALTARLRSGLHDQGFKATLGVAPTATAATWIARWKDGLVIPVASRLPMMLADLPLTQLPCLAAHRELLESTGLRRFRDLMRLPRDGIARRFGTATLVDMDQALGRQPDLRRAFEPPWQFASTLLLPADVDDAEALLTACRRQLGELCGWLAARHGAVTGFVIEARHERARRDRHEPPTIIDVRFAEPTADLQRMSGVLRERLATLKLVAPVHTLVLHGATIVPRVQASSDLFPTPASEEADLGRLVERLQARLGRHQVQRIALAEDHRPEASYRMQACQMVVAAEPAAPLAGQAEPDVPRPLWLLEPPVALAERAQRPWWNGPLRLLAGPERIESGWWDDGLVQRDYFIAEDEQARWVWIYRTRTTSRADGGVAGRRTDHGPGGSGWFLQGVFG